MPPKVPSIHGFTGASFSRPDRSILGQLNVMLTNDVVNFCICLRFLFGVGLQFVSQETGRLWEDFQKTLSWTSLPLRQVKDTTGGTGNFPLSHTVRRFRGFEENSTVLLVVFIVVLQNVTRIKVPRLECAMLIPSIPSILNTFTNGNGHAPIPMRSNGGFFARWMGHKMLHHHTGPVGGCEKKPPSGMIFIVGHASWIYLGYSEWSWILKSQSTDASGWVQWRFKLGSP